MLRGIAAGSSGGSEMKCQAYRRETALQPRAVEEEAVGSSKSGGGGMKCQEQWRRRQS